LACHQLHLVPTQPSTRAGFEGRSTIDPGQDHRSRAVTGEASPEKIILPEKADARLLSGSVSIDQSMLTGKSVAVERDAGELISRRSKRKLKDGR
jgi:hypothetical protein